MRQVRLGDYLEVQAGFAFKTEYFTSGEGVPLIRIRDLDQSQTVINYSGEYKPDFVVNRGDYLIGMDGNFRCYRWQGKASLLNQRVCRLRNFREGIEPEYVFYGIQRKLQEIENNTSFVTVKHLSAKQVQNIEMPLPPLPEQRRIVDLLSRAEGIVRLRREAEKKAAELIPALFLDMFGDPGRNPKGWPSKPLDAVLAETKLGLVRGAKETADDKPFPYLRMDAVGGGYVRATGLKRVDATSTEITDYSLRYGDFLFNTRNSKELVGKTGMFIGASEPVVLFNNNLMRMRFDQQILVPEYVNALFQTKHMQNQLDSIKRGTTSVFAIYYKDLRHLQLSTPPLGMQADFARHVSLVQSIQVQNAMATLKAKATFDALLAQAFTN